ncbi:[protein-PII] uridylyltransferase [Streptomyces lonarensis]|uniref:Bifunctional uridylyltransferase/uridylyl-removing enzyme n=1 Tax=Streptomyces lonarensis TaxID=700599 RepID=A0A7X6CXR7_9ACTN|nr:[protein-PII] uridylyltransferase [Streptomyces lonarensis]NJQ04551.1 [protein-PII] uridylyltransferase [Streptomyces lonarensis]
MTPETTGTTAVPAPDAGPSGNYAASRLLLLTRGEQAGAPRRAELARLTDAWLADLHAAAAPRADGAVTALVAVGGYGRGELSPRSDLDLLLLHEGTPSAGLATLADRLWYPVWDLGIALDHSVRDITTTRETARDDLKVRMGLLDARHVAGDARLTERLRTAQLADWRSEAPARLPELQQLAAERTRRYGELPHLLEPDLKEARGGLRDVTALRAVAASWVADAPRAGLAEAQAALLDVRDALHLTTGRSTDRLAQEDQPQVADALGLLDPDALLRRVYEASRVISYAWDVTWREVARVLRPRGEAAAPGNHRNADSARHLRPARGGRGNAPLTDRRPLADGVVEHEGEAALARTARPERDPVLLLRAAAAAARNGLPIALPALRRLAETAAPLPVPWPAEAREEFVTLLGTGPGCLPVWEAMTAVGLVTRLLPDWERVHCRPQRNPVHRWTVDRHLIETAVQAAALARTVHRPDLLLVASLLHDIGKGWPGDHSVVGETIARDTALRIGFGTEDTAVIAALVRHHLLLVETATRRDLDDPATVRGVAEAVGTVGTLDLLHALTTADALATGPAAWSRWRASLVADLVGRTRAALAGETTGAPPPAAKAHDEATDGAEGLAREALRGEGPILVLGDPEPGTGPRPGGVPRHEEPAAAPPVTGPRAGEDPEPVGVALTVALPERPGVLPAVAGLLVLHRLTVRSATLRTVTPGSAGPVLVMRWRVAAVYGALPDEDRLRADLVRVLEGSLDVAGRLAERDAAARPRRRRYPLPPAPRVGIAARSDSSRATVLEVRAPDAPGLLHRIGHALEGREVRVRSAHVATLGADAVDSFYLTDSAGLPLTAERSAAVVTAVEDALRD